MRSLFFLRKIYDFFVFKLKFGMIRKYVIIYFWDGGNVISSNKDIRLIKVLIFFFFNVDL